MKKITSQKLTKRLAQYGALSVAIASVSETDAQVQYYDIGAAGGLNQLFEIDLNQDTTPDFRVVDLAQGSASSAGWVFIYNGSLAASFPALASNSFLGSQPGAYIYPFALSSGQPINSTQGTWFNAVSNVGTMNFASCFGGSGSSNWCGETEKFLGLRITIPNGPGPFDDEVYYGWARVTVAFDAMSWEVLDFAYEQTSGIGINAGDGLPTAGIDDNAFSKIKVVALNKSIGLYNLQDSSRYSVINMTGQEVLKGETQNRDYVIEAPTLASGVYIIELNDTNSDAVMRKKIVLQ
ncbi:T9SS type A sorting domain-containing protein [Yeosuana sp. MJ-SS3]|uniref:T9SS type A sorting domain-containing protein n=1 Tax=Gilvirhabdus luticola TaxID=3079858 RepID=A0ABU3U5T0_9FLAO|nr:T9SS type A sorting domain-containing protein [Yeosuana sp. MJ-SS3]MDU8885769.1 T9SS type A sorting domain-containing protein [Yeosuana sp. MJ-SS3]